MNNIFRILNCPNSANESKLVEVQARNYPEAEQRIREWVQTHHTGATFEHVGELQFKIKVH